MRIQAESATASELIFLSHNKRDAEVARDLSLQLEFCGVRVWIDEWEIRAGDSIAGKLNEGLAGFTTFVLVWSAHASRSNWVRAELEAAISRSIERAEVKVIPVRLDDTPLPPLLASRRRIDLTAAPRRNLRETAREILGVQRDRDYRRSVQRFLQSGELRIQDFPGVGPMVGCPACGADVARIQGWEQADETRGDRYAGARCLECGWNDGGGV